LLLESEAKAATIMKLIYLGKNEVVNGQREIMYIFLIISMLEPKAGGKVGEWEYVVNQHHLKKKFGENQWNDSSNIHPQDLQLNQTYTIAGPNDSGKYSINSKQQ
jgi:hypothetical protein